MRNTVVFSTNTPAVSGAGFTDSFSTLLTTRGYLKRASQNRSLSFGEIVGNEDYLLYVRFQSTIDSNLRSDIKITVDGVVYKMNGRPELIDERKHIYKFNIQCQLP